MTEHVNEDTTGESPDDSPSPDDLDMEDGWGLPSTDETIIKLYWIAIGGVALLGAIAVIQLYTSVSAAITIWIASEYEPILQAVFNLTVLLLSILVGMVLIRRVSALTTE